MFYKKIVVLWIISLITLVTGTWLCSILVDPLGIWRLTSTQGFNHYKSKQGSYLDVWKPYQYSKIQPDIVYIGSSRVYVGLPAGQYGNERIYNMGASSLSIKDMRRYISFMYQIHKPKEIYIGLDFFQFGKENYHMQRNGFSEERLENIQQSGIKRFFYQSAESIAFAKYIPITIYESWKHRNEFTFLYGWDKKRGNAPDTNRKEYYGYLNSSMRDDERWRYEPRSMEDLQAIIIEAKKENVKIHLFFNPLSVDLYALLDVSGKLDEFNQIKLQVAQIAGVFDFAFVNEMTMNRELFYDASHYKKAIGEEILNHISQNTGQNSCYLLKNNSRYFIDEEMKAYEEWKEVNKKYVELLQEYYFTKRTFAEGDLERFIGW